MEMLLKRKNLLTNENKYKDIFGGVENALSEDVKSNGVYAKEYEVFQIYLNNIYLIDNLY